MISLRPYQQEALAATRDAFVRGIRRPLISLPTGTGKTVIFSSVTKGAAAKGRRVLILAHRDELLRQSADKLVAVAPELAMRIGFVKASTDDYDHDVVIASVQTLARPKRLAKIVEENALSGRPFDVVIVDEAHHAAADSYQSILYGLGSFEADGPLTIGVTATPQRADAKDLGATWQEIVYHRDMLSMMRERYLCDLRGRQIRLEALDLGSVKVTAGDYNAGDVGDALEVADAPEHGVRAWHKYAAGRKTIVFTPTIALAEEFASEFTRTGVPAVALSGNTPTDERRSILRRFHEGEIRVIANAQVLTEGFDEPDVECIVIARPTKSQPMYVQMVGRGTRLSPGKKDCLVLDLVGATDRLDLTTLPRLFGLGEDGDGESSEGSVSQGGSILDAASEHDERERKAGRIASREVELFSRAELAWVAVGPGRWLLDLGDEKVELLARGDRWDVVAFAKGKLPRKLAEGLEQGYAMGTGDDYARGSGELAGKLIDKAARWRQRPASSKQLGTLAKLKVAIPHGVSAGEASDLLSAAIARKQR